MKKIHKLVLKAFIGPFILTYAVVVFIFVTQTLIKYFDEIVGKGLGFMVYAKLLFYFSINVSQIAFPLAILLSSLIAFGNLGEFNELTAVKGSGISLVRVLQPVFFFAVGLTLFAFWFNNNLVPKANLRAYSLLYDVRQKKPSLSIKEGIFYSGLDGVSIKANKKFPDEKSMKEIMIYDHREGNGNSRLILADSAQMYTILGEKYLVFELFDGTSYDDQSNNMRSDQKAQFVRNHFKRTKMVFSLASFEMDTTDTSLFKYDRLMKNFRELEDSTDSLAKDVRKRIETSEKAMPQYYSHHLKPFTAKLGKRTTASDTTKTTLSDTTKPALVKTKSASGKNRALAKASIASGSTPAASVKAKVAKKPRNWLDSTWKALQPKKLPQYSRVAILESAASQARNIKTNIEGTIYQLDNASTEYRKFEIERHRRFTQSVACLAMFLIGAPLGAIIRKGGLGVPVLVSIGFFILFYVLTLLGEKWAREAVIQIPYGAWLADFVLIVVGLFFLRQARNDSRLFEADVYKVAFSKFVQRLQKKKTREAAL